MEFTATSSRCSLDNWSKSTPKQRTTAAPRTPRSHSQALPPSSLTHNRCINHCDNDLEELEEHIIMAVDRSSNGKIGCAYYIARHELLYCMQDVEKGGLEAIELLKVDIEPTIMLISPRIDSNNDLHNVAQGQSDSLAKGREFLELPYEMIVRPAVDFKYDNAIMKLSALKLHTSEDNIRFLVPGENMDYQPVQNHDELGLTDQRGKLLRIASSLDLENRLSIGCAGAVVGYLQRRRASEYLEQDPQAETAYRVSRLEMFTLRDTMQLNTDTLSSLQIIQSETHPTIDSQGPDTSNSKESLSVYGLFHGFAKTPQGKAQLRQIFLRPSLNIRIIQKRHDFISIMVRPENRLICDTLSNSLRRIKNMQTFITLLHKGINRSSQGNGTIRSGAWAALLEFCYHGIDVADTLKEVNSMPSLMIRNNTMDILDKTRLQRLGKMIHDVVDLDESLEQQRTVIKSGINNELDQVKDAYRDMEEILAGIATKITNAMPININTKLNVIYLPQLGFHITVPLDEETHQAIWTGDESWEPRFRTEKYQYFKNRQMRDMDTCWGDLHANICDTEIEISHNLAQRVLEDENWIIEASNLFGELDSLLALAHGAIQYNLSRPKIVEENIIDIKGGRHILQEMIVPSYVPNDTFLAGGDARTEESGRPSMMLLTGPNYSGKSVYKKQVALIVYMAQIGSFVPADAATLGITDSIMTRINTVETVSKIQSAFLVDLQQIAWALKCCTNRSLIVVDEFGKGTDTCDGAGLAAGLFQHLLELGSECPKVLASTHFHEIFEQGDFEKYPGLAFAYMQIHIDIEEGKRQESSHVTYLYKLHEGRSTLSYGVQCAVMNGIPRRIVDRADLLADLIVNGEDLVATCASLPRTEVEELEDAENICRKFLSKNLDDQSINVGIMLQNFRSLDTTMMRNAEWMS